LIQPGITEWQRTKIQCRVPHPLERGVYLTKDDHIHELFVTLGSGWQHADLTQLAGAPPVFVSIEPPPDDRPTPPTPPPSEETSTTTIFLQKQEIYSGPIPYTAQFPAIGSIHNGKLKSLSNPSNGFNPIYISLVKKGYSTADCNNSNAVVVLGPGRSTTPNDISAIYGSATPALPVGIVACISVQTVSSLPNSVAVDVTYTHTP
jgi:hypothetical protein